MNVDKLGLLVGHAVMHILDESGANVCKLVGNVPGNSRVEYLILIMWTVTKKVLGKFTSQLAHPTLDVMHRVVYDKLFQAEIDKVKFEDLLHNRYAGYWAATAGESAGDSMRHIANYFFACCRTSNHSVRYEEIIPDPEDITLMADGLTPGALEKLQYLRESNITRPTQWIYGRPVRL